MTFVVYNVIARKV